jgi:hypothetical protein
MEVPEMKVLELLSEIEEIMDTSSSFPLTGKVLVDAGEIMEIVKEIRQELPDEIQQAQWIKNERQRILDEAKVEYEELINTAKGKAESMVENNEITIQAKNRAEEIMNVTEANVKALKMGTFEYIDDILYSLQQKMDQMNVGYLHEMYSNIQNTFEQINETISSNRSEIKDLSDKTENDRK